MEWDDKAVRRLSTRELRMFLAVAHSGSMAKAAKALATSQPAISKAIADMEHNLGVRLLDRSPQGVEPTQYGRALVKCGLAVFYELKQGINEIGFLADPTAGELKAKMIDAHVGLWPNAKCRRDQPMSAIGGQADELCS